MEDVWFDIPDHTQSVCVSVQISTQKSFTQMHWDEIIKVWFTGYNINLILLLIWHDV